MTTSVFGKTLRALSGIASTTAIGANAIGTLVVLGLVLIVNFDVVARGGLEGAGRGGGCN